MFSVVTYLSPPHSIRLMLLLLHLLLPSALLPLGHLKSFDPPRVRVRWSLWKTALGKAFESLQLLARSLMSSLNIFIVLAPPENLQGSS